MGETSNRGIATGKWTSCSGMSTLDFWDRNRKIDEDESCSRDCALSKESCPTDRFHLEVPQWIDFSSRGNFIFSKSYYNLNMNIGPPIFDFFMTQVRISKSMTPLKFTPTFPYIIDQKRICFSEKSGDFQKLQNVSNGIKSSTV